MHAISTKALANLRPLVVSIVDQNVKEIRRNSSNMTATEEQKHLNYIADVCYNKLYRYNFYNKI